MKISMKKMKFLLKWEKDKMVMIPQRIEDNEGLLLRK